MITKTSQRKRKAYGVSLKIALSYGRLFILKRFFSEKKYIKRLNRKHEKNAVMLKSAILELNGLFIKVGQLLSIMSAVLPEAYSRVLESLQDNTPSSSYEDTERTVLSEFGESIPHLFQSFQKETIASASIGQVHKAILKSGEEVAVKVQHPHIEQLAKLDLKIIKSLINMVMRIFKITGLDFVYSQVEQMIYEELDYVKEAESIQLIKENCKSIDGIIIPEVLTAYSSRRILVTSFEEGTKITNIDQLLEWGVDPENISKKLVYVYCEMILKYGVYHADPHPGNLLVNKAGEVVILDFGAIGRLSENMRSEIPIFIQAVVNNDEDKVLKSMKKMGFIGKDKSSEKTAQKIIAALNEFISGGVDLESLNYDTLKNSNLDSLRKELSIKELTTTLEVPKDWILLERTLLLLVGICTKISPKYNPMDTVKPYMKNMLFNGKGIRDLIVSTLKNQVNTMIGLPKKVDTVLSKANKGEIEFIIKDLDKNVNRFYGLGQQIGFGVLAVVALIMANYSYMQSNIKYENIFTGVAIFLGFLFLFSLWKSRRVRHNN